MNKQEINDAINYFKRLRMCAGGQGIKRIDSYDLAIYALTQQLTDGWVPTETNSDNPLVGGEYQVTVRYENFAGIYEMAGVATFTGSEWIVHGTQPVIANKKVIAWKPLDKPYKEVSE